MLSGCYGQPLVSAGDLGLPVWEPPNRYEQIPVFIGGRND